MTGLEDSRPTAAVFVALLLIKHRFQVSERIVGCRTHILLCVLSRNDGCTVLIGFGIFRVFMIVAVEAQQFPVAAVRRVIGVVVIDMMHR